MFRPLLLALLLPALPAGGQQAPDPDFERAFEAVRRGEIRPLGQILPGVETRFGGRAIETELETEDGRWVYDIEILAADGRLFEVEVDAVTGEILEIEEEVD